MVRRGCLAGPVLCMGQQGQAGLGSLAGQVRPGAMQRCLVSWGSLAERAMLSCTICCACSSELHEPSAEM